jgi:hypothetical protein
MTSLVGSHEAPQIGATADEPLEHVAQAHARDAGAELRLAHVRAALGIGRSGSQARDQLVEVVT